MMFATKMKIFASLLLATTTFAGTYTNGPLIVVSTTNLVSDCTADDVAGQVGVGSTIFTNTEVGGQRLEADAAPLEDDGLHVDHVTRRIRLSCKNDVQRSRTRGSW
jgi:hypothetical protein